MLCCFSQSLPHHKWSLSRWDFLSLPLISLTAPRQHAGGRQTGHEICLPISTLRGPRVTSHHWQAFLGKRGTKPRLWGSRTAISSRWSAAHLSRGRQARRSFHWPAAVKSTKAITHPEPSLAERDATPGRGRGRAFSPSGPLCDVIWGMLPEGL